MPTCCFFGLSSLNIVFFLCCSSASVRFGGGGPSISAAALNATRSADSGSSGLQLFSPLHGALFAQSSHLFVFFQSQGFRSTNPPFLAVTPHSRRQTLFCVKPSISFPLPPALYGYIPPTAASSDVLGESRWNHIAYPSVALLSAA